MIIAAIIVGLIIIGLVCFINYMRSNILGDTDFGVILGTVFTISCVIEILLLIGIMVEPKPTALDVYQDKTTLKYTIIDSIKVDSIVVFKENYYGKD